MSRNKFTKNGPSRPEDNAPRALLPIEKVILNETKRKVRIVSDGQSKEVSTEEVIVRKVLQTAASGSPHAQGHAIRYLLEAQRAEAAFIANEVEKGERFKAYAEKLVENAMANGHDPNLVTPHPDDIVVTAGVGWDMIGPPDPEGLADILKRSDERNAFYVQATLEERLATKQEWLQAGGDFQCQPGSLALFMMYLIDSTLPKRFRLTAYDLLQFDRTYNGMTRRELLKHTVAVWRKPGKRVPRGSRLPVLNDKLPLIHAVYGTAGAMLTREKAGNPMDLNEITDELEERMR